MVKKLTISQEEIDNNLKPKIKGKKLEELSSPWVGYVSDIEGKVIIIRHNNDGTSVLINFEAKEGDLVHEKDVFDVGPKSSVELTLKNETEISLAPSTTFRMYQHYVDENEQNSLFNLLSGKARINVKKEKKITSIKLYASNVVISSKKADFATSYDDMKKTSMVACLGGEISILGMTDNKERKSYAQFLGEDEYMNITTSYDGETENYINTDPTKMSRNYKKTVLESFSADYRELDPWEFTRISTSFFRIALGLEYANIQELSTRYYNFSIGYLPLIHAFSIFYLEPYFFLSIPSSKELFLRAGTSLVLYLYRGFYAGSGVGAFWITDGAGSKMDLNFSTGYTFSDKQMGIIDGLRFEYFISRTPRYRSNGIILSLVLNFSSGRDEEE
ncbi:MAG: FecR domain-containing protein [Proteobacteria bacterium]|nr:FecR domain-containing protein [Pseudomonadota bacterium]